MDRDRIERRDFPTGRRGYDPAAVDEHLRRVADEFEARAHAPTPSMADSTSEQVRLILAAAERGAAELRSTAGTEASEHVARVQAAADSMLGKLDALESELSRLLSALRTSGERLVEGLAELQAEATGGHTPPPAAAGDATDPRDADLPSPAITPTDATGGVAGPRAADVSGAIAPPPTDALPSADLPGAVTEPTAPAHADGGAAGLPPEHPPSRAKPGSGGGLDAPPEHVPGPGAESPDSPSPVADSSTPADPGSPDLVAESPASPSPASSSPASSSPDAESLDPQTPAAQDPASPELAAGGAAHESPPLSAPGAPDWPAPAEALFDAPSAGDSLFVPAEPDEAGARMIALNMALGGSPRDDTRIFLEEHFELPDIEALLDDVYARAGR